MSFILGSLVSASSATAASGQPFMFLQEEIDAINDLIMKLQNGNNVLHYEQTTPVTVTPATGDDILIKYAEWKIEKDDNFFHNATRFLYDSSIYANIDGDIVIGWFKSKDGMTWRAFEPLSASTSSPVVEEEFGTILSISSEFNHIAFGTLSFSDSDGVVKDFSGTITIHLAPGQSLNQILP